MRSAATSEERRAGGKGGREERRAVGRVVQGREGVRERRVREMGDGRWEMGDGI